jgi:hypothetical protein
LEPYEALLLDLSLPIAREEMRLPKRQKALCSKYARFLKGRHTDFTIAHSQGDTI